MIELNGKYTNANIMIDVVEDECVGQKIKAKRRNLFINIG